MLCSAICEIQAKFNTEDTAERPQSARRFHGHMRCDVKLLAQIQRVT
jgi:hypothetical protein